MRLRGRITRSTRKRAPCEVERRCGKGKSSLFKKAATSSTSCKTLLVLTGALAVAVCDRASAGNAPRRTYEACPPGCIGVVTTPAYFPQVSTVLPLVSPRSILRRVESRCAFSSYIVAALHTVQYDQIVPSAVALTCRFLRVRFTTAVTCNDVSQAIGCG
jgi:hypothetical protein